MLARLPLKILNMGRDSQQPRDTGNKGQGKTRNRREGKERTLESFHALHLSKNRFSVCLWVCLCLSFLCRLWMETCLFKCFTSRACALWAWFLSQSRTWSCGCTFGERLQAFPWPCNSLWGLDKTLPAPSFLKLSAAFSKISVKSIFLPMLHFLQVRCLSTSKGGSLSLWGMGCT